MTARAPPGNPTSARLLRVVSLLAAQVDPEGARTRSLDPLREDVRELLDEEGFRLSKAVQSLLSSAVASLSSATSTIPYLDCLSALSAITSALPLLVYPSSPRPSSFSRLPAELVTCIIDFCQDEDLRLRQNTNFALSSTCRALYTAVRPILAAELHLFTARQLERVATRCKKDALSFRRVETLSVDLELAEIERQPDSRWAGRLLFPFVADLKNHGCLRSLHVRFRPPHPPSLRNGVRIDNASEYFFAALGLDPETWQEITCGTELSGLDELVLAMLEDYPDETIAALVRESGATRLRLGDSSAPHLVSATAIDRALPGGIRESNEGLAEQYEQLAMPFAAFHPATLSSILLSPTGPPILQHFEATFRLRDFDEDLDALLDLLRGLAPSLRHFCGRFKRTEHDLDDVDDFQTRLAGVLRSCEKLEHLEIGGSIIDERIAPELDNFPSLRTVVFLPMGSILEPDVLLCTLPTGCPTLRQITVCTPDISQCNSQDPWSEHNLSYGIWRGERANIQVRYEERAVEWDWVASNRDE
ncbi:hypothetical protein JCM10213_004358 [Rhodosporidiobolus nylandii]